MNYNPERSKISKIRKEMINQICEIDRSILSNKDKIKMLNDLKLLDDTFRLGFKNIINEKIAQYKEVV